MKSIERRVCCILKLFDTYLKRKSNATAIKFQRIFDITDATGVWLSTENKLFYKQQLDSNGNIGFCTNKITDIPVLHLKEFCLEKHNLVGEMNMKVAMIVLWK